MHIARRPLNDARQLHVTQRETNLRVERILCLVRVGAHLQLEWFRFRNHRVGLGEPGAAEAVLARAHPVQTALVDAQEVVVVAGAARESSQLGGVRDCGCVCSGTGEERTTS